MTGDTTGLVAFSRTTGAGRDMRELAAYAAPTKASNEAETITVRREIFRREVATPFIFYKTFIQAAPHSPGAAGLPATS
ncbi:MULTISPECIES: hypothetical protein [Edaphosphingomonas]|uniref:hypothetical protein n=1 Tax=Edaphosphingomonas TaxID=3423724 RepID=UPI0011133BAF|nr:MULTISPECIES: hypothetical protein [Sphingomonas]